MAFPHENDTEFIAGYSPILRWAQEEIQKMISDVDDDGSGTIGYEELLGFHPFSHPRGIPWEDWCPTHKSYMTQIRFGILGDGLNA